MATNPYWEEWKEKWDGGGGTPGHGATSRGMLMNRLGFAKIAGSAIEAWLRGQWRGHWRGLSHRSILGPHNGAPALPAPSRGHRLARVPPPPAPPATATTTHRHATITSRHHPCRVEDKDGSWQGKAQRRGVIGPRRRDDCWVLSLELCPRPAPPRKAPPRLALPCSALACPSNWGIDPPACAQTCLLC